MVLQQVRYVVAGERTVVKPSPAIGRASQGLQVGNGSADDGLAAATLLSQVGVADAVGCQSPGAQYDSTHQRQSV